MRWHGRFDPRLRTTAPSAGSETVSLDDVNDKLSAMTDFGTEGIPVIDEC